MNTDAPLPVWLLTGFLGSGKTTLLARLLRHPDLADTAVIVNEFGEVGLDHMLVARGEEDNVVLLDSGCLCCSMGDSLSETLTDLYHRRSRGELAPFARVVIETTGMADPGPILRSLMADRVMTQRFRVAALVTTVDGVFGREQLARHTEARRQVALADRIVVTKRDVAGEGNIAELAESLTRYNPRAEILSAAAGDVDPERLLAFASPDSAESKHEHDHAHDGGINTVFLPVPEAIGWAAYAAIVSYLQRELGERLLRAKGVLRIEGEARPVVVQGVQHLFAPPVELEREHAGVTGLVLIGEQLDRAQLAADLAAFGVNG